MDHSWLRFADSVTIRSGRSVQECVRSLQQLTARPGSFTAAERNRPFRGQISAEGGYLRNPLLRRTAINCRVLRFQFIASESGTELRGQWKLMRRFRIPVMVYLTVCVVSEICGVLGLLWPGLNLPFGGLLGPVIGFAMLYGWAWIFVVLSRKSESQLINGVFHAMASDDSARVVREVLSFGYSRVEP
jgi:hypothetical protein